jgi:hypothetical protein
MKNILVILILLNCVAVAQIPPPPIYFSTGGMSNGSLNIANERQVIVMDQISNDAVVDIKAYEEIILQSPTDLISYTNNGSFRAAINPSTLDPVSYHPYGWSGISKHDRLEIGVSLPTIIDQYVENFLNKIPAISMNPYDPDQIMLKGTYTNGGNTYERFGFYYREIAYTNNGTDYLPSKSNKPFRIRFAPNATGRWDFSLELFVNGVSVATYNGHFDCIDAGKPGPISVNSLARFQFGNGNTFFPIGQDFGPLVHDNGPNQCGGLIQPLDVDEYIGHINNLADVGGNFIRIPTDPINFYLEWEEPRVYGSNRTIGENFRRQFSAHSLDRVLTAIENRNVYAILLNESNLFFQIDPDYYCGALTDVKWPHHPYAKLLEYNVSQPIDFFSNSDVYNVYKKKLFYIQARYGYSRNISFEVCNEINSIQKGTSIQYDSAVSTQITVYNWAVNVAAYYNSFYPNHLMTISFAGDGPLTQPQKSTNPTNHTEFQFRTPHNYGHNIDACHGRQVNVQPQLFGAGDFENIGTTVKPVLFGEMGMTDNTEGDKCTDVEFHNGMWTSGCSGASGAGLYRYGYQDDNRRNNHIPSLKAFFDNMPFATDEFGPRYDKDPGGQNPDIEAIYNVTRSAHKAYGWLHNRTFYWPNDPYLVPNCINNYNGESIGTAFPKNNTITLAGFQKGKKYTIELWYTYGAGGVYTTFDKTSGLLSGEIKFTENLGTCFGCPNAPDYGFKIYKKDAAFRLVSDPYSNNDKGHQYLPNDSITLLNPTLVIPGLYDKNISYHYWSLGNGMTSHEATPTFENVKSGDYDVVYSTLNSFGDTVAYHQKVHIIVGDSDHASFKNTRPVALEIIPNPTNGTFHIRISEDVTVETIYMYDSKGALVQIFQGENKTVNIVNFVNGLYNIILYTDHGLFSKKVILQH